jgi:hypothetical protein
MEYTLKANMAFVVQLSETTPGNLYDSGINQKVTEKFAVVVAIDNATSAKETTGIVAHDELFGIRAELFSAILGWQISGTEGIISFAGGRLLEMDRARMWYQFEFETTIRIDDDDGFDNGADTLPTMDTVFAEYDLNPITNMTAADFDPDMTTLIDFATNPIIAGGVPGSVIFIGPHLGPIQDNPNFNYNDITNVLHVEGLDIGDGGLTLEGMTEGSVFFASPTGAITQDNANFNYTDATNLLSIKALDLGDGNISSVGCIFFDTSFAGSAHTEGKLFWDTDDGTLSLDLPGGSVSGQLFQENLIRGKNQTGSATPDGLPVLISGASGNKPEFSFTDTDNVAADDTVGLFTENVTTGANGFVTTFGYTRDIDTSGTPFGEVWAAGDKIYGTITAGDLTNVMATDSSRKVFIGYVIRAHATEGVLFAHPKVTAFLNELSGVDGSAPLDKALFGYNETTTLWEQTTTLLYDFATGNVDLGGNNFTDVGNLAVDTISSAGNTSIVVNLGTDAGDDLLVGNNNALVVEGDTERTGFGVLDPGGKVEIVASSDSLGPELLTNGDFSNWTTDDPDNWEVIGEDANAEVSEVGSTEDHGGSGTGSCNLWTDDGGFIHIRQNVMVVSSMYRLTFDITASTTGSLKGGSAMGGHNDAFSGESAVASYSFDFVALNTRMAIGRTGGNTDITIDNVSLKQIVGTPALIVKEAAMSVGNIIEHRDTSDNVQISFGTGGSSVFNEQGNDVDWRVEGVTQTHMLFGQAATDRFGVNESTPLATAHFSTKSATEIGQIIQGFSSQSGDFVQLNDDVGAVLTRFDSAGHLGIGLAPEADNSLRISRNYGTMAAGISKPFVMITSGTGEAGGASSLRVFEFQATTQGANDTLELTAITGNVVNETSAGTMATQTVISAGIRMTGAGDTSDGSVYRAIPILSSTGDMAIYRAFDSRSPIISGAGGIGDGYGLYLREMNHANVTNPWGVYQLGANDVNYFQGKIGINDLTPEGMLDIDNSTTSSASFFSQNGVLAVNQRAFDFRVNSDLSNSGSNGILVYSNAAHSANNGLVKYWNDNSSAINDVLVIDNDGKASAIYIDHDDTGSEASVDIDRDGNSASSIAGLAIDTVNIGAGNAYALITTNGDVGFGTNNPSTQLHVVGNTTLDGDFTLISETISVSAASTITPTKSHIEIAGNGGPVTMTANPQIAAGADGDIMIVHGTSDSNTVTLVQGNGLHLHGGNATLTNKDRMMFEYHVAENEWQELFRNFQIFHRAWPFSSPTGGGATFFIGGHYDFGATDNDFNPSITHGTANKSEAAHIIFIQAAGGALGTDTVIRVSGISINDQGSRNPADTEDVTIDDAGAAGTKYETAKKWLGQVTIVKISGPDLLCNYGWAKYWDRNNTAFRVLGFEATWLAGGNDNNINIQLRRHAATGWTYNAGAPPTPPPVLASLSTDHSTDDQAVSGENGAWKRDDLNTTIDGGDSEGLLLEVTTTVARTFQIGSFEIIVRPD